MEINFERSIELNGRPVTLSLDAEVTPARDTCHATTEVSVGLDDLESGSSAAANAALWPAAEAWCLQHAPELEREALERADLGYWEAWA